MQLKPLQVPPKDNQYLPLSTQYNQDLEDSEKSSTSQTKNGLLGMLCMFIAALCVSLMTFLIKLTYIKNPSITAYDIIYWQGVIATSCFILQAKFKGIDLLNVPKDLRTTLVMRGVYGAVAHSAYLTSLNLLEMSKTSCIFWSNPMIVAVIAYFRLNERITKYDITALLLAFCGVLLIQDPFSSKSDGKERTYI